ncbi:MAG: ATP-binding cassette domain-containing protein [Phycisphaeraceae bacterium]|nr:ATP-binding cassette domain-containing protein [Phycisphaeraceae bacterium]
MIQAHELTKWYGPNLAIDRLSFEIPRGQIVGFLGPNGAGKTTTLRILTGYLPPTAGTAQVAGFDVLAQAREARQKIGYLPEHTPLYPEMRVEEYLHFRGQVFNMDRRLRKARIDVVVDRCGLQPVRRRLIGRLSKGNRQRVGLAQALLHDPPLLILDEPTAGLDPNQITEIRNLFAELRGQHTILLSTHILPEVEKTADRVMIIAGGRIVANGSLAELRQKMQAGAKVLVELAADPAAVQKALASLPGVAEVTVDGREGWCQAVVQPKGMDDLRQAIGQAAANNRWAIRELRAEHASLESYFIRITAQQNQAIEAA